MLTMSAYQLLGIAATVVFGIAAMAIIVFAALRGAGLAPSLKTGAEVPPEEPVRHRSDSVRALAHRRRQRVRLGLQLAALAVFLGAAAEGVTLAVAVSDLNRGVLELTDASSALGTSPEGWTSDRIGTADGLGSEAQSLVGAADRRISGDPVLGALGGMPFVGEQLTAVVHLSDTARQGTLAFQDALTIARAVDASRTSADPPGTRLLRLLSEAAGPWRDTDARLSPALDRLRQDLTHQLLPPLASGAQKAVKILQPIDDLAKVGVVAAKFGPTALGASHPETYLVLLSNPSELRPAGGFNGSLGWVTIDSGAPSSIEVHPQESFNPLIKQHTDLPYPMGRYLRMLNNSLEIGDAAWDPDFPASARATEDLYAAATGRLPDNTVSIDPYALAAMLHVTGPVNVPGYGTFDESNFFAKLNFIVNVSTAAGSGKGALTPIGQEVLHKVLTTPASAWPRLFVVFQQQAERRHIQAYFHDAHLAAAAATVHYDGQVRTDSQDYLMVSDANVSLGKEDFYVHKSMQVSAEVSAGGLVRHQVQVRYQMPLPADAVDTALNPGDGSYRDYVRFYLPETATVAGFKATLDGSAGDGSLDAVSFAHGREVVGAFFRVPRGHETVLTLTYEVPINQASSYDLLIQKQAGIPNLPTSVLISYPGGISQRRTDLSADAGVSVAW
jgi:hypothetical protein